MFESASIARENAFVRHVLDTQKLTPTANGKSFEREQQAAYIPATIQDQILNL